MKALVDGVDAGIVIKPLILAVINVISAAVAFPSDYDVNATPIALPPVEGKEARIVVALETIAAAQTV